VHKYWNKFFVAEFTVTIQSIHLKTHLISSVNQACTLNDLIRIDLYTSCSIQIWQSNDLIYPILTHTLDPLCVPTNKNLGCWGLGIWVANVVDHHNHDMRREMVIDIRFHFMTKVGGPFVSRSCMRMSVYFSANMKLPWNKSKPFLNFS
jgi:hypothetical protein